ncbi:uncharacterized protein LOC144164823 [Haemaphysalis longicornis]
MAKRLMVEANGNATRRQQPTLAKQKKNRDGANSPSHELNSNVLGMTSGPGLPLLASPFNSLLILPSDDQRPPDDIPTESKWSPAQICVAVCAAIVFLIAIFFAGAQAIRTIAHFKVLHPLQRLWVSPVVVNATALPTSVDGGNGSEPTFVDITL